MPNLRKIKNIGKDLTKKELCSGGSGNISIRDNDLVYITKSGIDLDKITEDNIVFLPLDLEEFQKKRRGEELTPSIETELHIKTYKKTNAESIIHTHPLFTNVITKKLNEIEFGKEKSKIIGNKKINVLENKPPGSTDLADSVSNELKDKKATIVREHGLFVRAKTLDRANKTTKLIEKECKLVYLNNLLK